MLLRQPLQPLLSALLLLGCARAPATQVSTAAAPKSLDYFTIEPDVSVSRNALPYEEPRTTIDPNADVMAEILALPPGPSDMHREGQRPEPGALPSLRPNYAPWLEPPSSPLARAR
jgi:hypothetical protein